MLFAICAGLRLARFNPMLDDPDRPRGRVISSSVCRPGRRYHRTVADLRFLSRPSPGALAHLADADLHAGHRLADDFPAAGLFRKAHRHASAARHGWPGHSLVVVLFFAILFSYPWELPRWARWPIWRACRSGGYRSRIRTKVAAEPGGSGASRHAVSSACGGPRAAARWRGSSFAPQLAETASRHAKTAGVVMAGGKALGIPIGRRTFLAVGAASLAAPPLCAQRPAAPRVTFKLHHALSSVSCAHVNFPGAVGACGGRRRLAGAFASTFSRRCNLAVSP